MSSRRQTSQAFKMDKLVDISLSLTMTTMIICQVIVTSRHRLYVTRPWRPSIVEVVRRAGARCTAFVCNIPFMYFVLCFLCLHAPPLWVLLFHDLHALCNLSVKVTVIKKSCWSSWLFTKKYCTKNIVQVTRTSVSYFVAQNWRWYGK